MPEENKRPALPPLRKAQIPRVAAVHGLVAYGNCSLSVPMAVLPAGGCEVLPFPSSVLSSHTAFPGFCLYKTDPALPEFLKQWKKIGVKPDGLYSGFLGSAELIRFIKAFTRQYPDAYRIIDPVMGDHGKRYATITDALAEGIKSLLPAADVLVPNLTEAAILTGSAYKGQNLSREDGKRLCAALLEKGARQVILKGMQRGRRIYNGVAAEGRPYRETETPLFPKSFYGTGDLFASCLAAALFSGHTLEDAAAFAAELVYDAVVFSQRQEGAEQRGIAFEVFLGRVASFCRREDLTGKTENFS